MIMNMKMIMKMMEMIIMVLMTIMVHPNTTGHLSN